MLSYEKYPMLLFTSYDKDNAPNELPFEMPDEATLQKVASSKGVRDLFSYIAVKNSLTKANSNTHFFLKESSFNTVEYNENQRNKYFGDFFSQYITPKNGCILFKNGGTYVYNLLSVQDTKKLYRKDGRYMVATLFNGDFFVGFEEGIITKKGVEVLQTGIYSGGMDIGGYLSFCIITLAMAEGKKETLIAENVKENILLI